MGAGDTEKRLCSPYGPTPCQPTCSCSNLAHKFWWTGAEPKIQDTEYQTHLSNLLRCQCLWDNCRFPMVHTAVHSPEALASFSNAGTGCQKQLANRGSRLTDYEPSIAAPPRLLFWTESQRSNSPSSLTTSMA